MWKELFFFSLLFGDSFKNDDSGGPRITKEEILEHVEVRIFKDIIDTATEIENQNPSPEMLAIQLKPLKMMFDKIKLKAIRTPATIKAYHQMKGYFDEHLCKQKDTRL